MEEEPKELKRAAGVLEHTFPGPIPLLSRARYVVVKFLECRRCQDAVQHW